ncbi:AraC family transcriptional regulator [Acetatifactor muris]|uniref:HTH-type transcriptional activator Btr n=1 Tax=Acetatifactor muris TaxID=879566 RepID=A0A2K4ZF87_9FIRM|nr:AraC family transcriptional regulator [Acetatifactor muris]MCI8801551.1 AraC family transcriptional regulator [Lachnospiraceae bacterium]MCR2047310.1 AraC family transcriptional regulator [Acetatifactor muris]SOY29116.1 HTH-type transcriptional activator Btr [Acetatifactor muris]
MEQVIFRQRVEGLIEAEQVIRENEFSMANRHFHDTYELYYLLEGERYYFIDKETYLVGAGDVVLVKPNQIHKTSMAKASYHNRILLQIKGEAFDTFLKSNGFLTLGELYDRNMQIIRLRKRDADMVKTMILQITEEIRERRKEYELMVKVKLLELLVLLARYRKNVLPDRKEQTAQTAKHQKVHEVADYLQTHPDTRECLEELAGRFYISKSYLSRIFKEVTGFGVNEYTNIVRVKKAQNLLIYGDYSVTEISELLGFESITYFERVFKKYTLYTPLRYRREKRA